MHIVSRRLAYVTCLVLFTLSAMTFSAGRARATTTPPLKWPSFPTSESNESPITDPLGNVTIKCDPQKSSGDLTTYNSTGAVVRDIPRMPRIDGVTNCMSSPVVDKHGTIYGIPFGEQEDGSWSYGPNLLAYTGNTLEWKYPLECTEDAESEYVVGADGNIYAIAMLADGVHLIGISPTLEAGETQPAKVFDIKLPDDYDCWTTPFAYKDGVVLQSYGGSSRYYSYGGKFLGELPAHNAMNEAFNFEGQQFAIDSQTTGDVQGVSLSMADIRKGGTGWTKTLSTPGANVQSWNQPTPMPNGEVAILFQEQKMIADNVPVTPEEYEDVITILNSAGQTVKTYHLPTADDQGNEYGVTISPLATDDGRLIIQRTLYHAMDSGSPSMLPEAVISVLDSNGNITSDGGTISGDTDPDNRYGYLPENHSTAGLDTLFAVETCDYACSDDDVVFPIEMQGLGLDYPRGAVLSANVSSQPAPEQYVALGDSFSSGEGVPPFEEGTDDSGQDECHRSNLAYPEILNEDPYFSVNLTPGGFAACSGATTNDVRGISESDDPHGKWSEPTQMDAITSDTKVITVTIGGDDIGFGGYASGCVDEPCGPGTPDYDNIVAVINSPTFLARLRSTYSDVLARATNPDAQIYVIDYPYIAPDGAGLCAGFDVSGAYSIETLLNSTIAEAVAETHSSKLHYVNTNVPGSPFNGKDICGSDSDFNGLDLAHHEYSLHPNMQGQRDYARVVKSYIESQ